MDSMRLLGCLADEVARLRTVAAGNLAARVPTCPGWTVGDLVRHVANGYLNVVLPRLRSPESAPVHDLAGREPLAALDDGHATMADEFAAHLDRDHPTPDAAEVAPFWIRRMTHETVIHRVDSELAVGRPPEPIEPDLAVDGIDELLTVFLAQETQQWTEQYARYLSDWRRDSLLVSAGDAQWRMTVRPQGADVTPVSAGRTDAESPPGAQINGPPDPLLRWAYNRGGADQVSTTGDAGMITKFTQLLTAVTSIGA